MIEFHRCYIHLSRTSVVWLSKFESCSGRNDSEDPSLDFRSSPTLRFIQVEGNHLPEFDLRRRGGGHYTLEFESS